MAGKSTSTGAVVLKPVTFFKVISENLEFCVVIVTELLPSPPSKDTFNTKQISLGSVLLDKLLKPLSTQILKLYDYCVIKVNKNF